MPYGVSRSFDLFIERISLDGDQHETANARARRISELLGTRFDILDIFATGSMVRGTGLRGKCDVDVMAVLHFTKHIEGKTPRSVLQSVRDALAGYNAQIVKKNGQAVTLYFETWPNVDIVPAKRIQGDGLMIPDANAGGWISTDPAAHDRAMARLSERGRQLVRMVKCWNQAHSEYFISFHIEQVALSMFVSEGGAEDDWPWRLKTFFEKAAEMTGPYAPMSEPYSVDDWSALRSRLSRAKDLAYEAWTAVRSNQISQAVARCQVLFGDKFPAYG